MKPESYQLFAQLLEGFVNEASTSMNLIANQPGGKEVVQKLNNEMNKSISDSKFVEKVLTPISVEAIGGSPEEFGAFMKTDREVTSRLAKLAKITANQ